MKKFTIAALCILFLNAARTQQNAFPKLRLETYASGFDAPSDIVNCGDSRLFVTERVGRIWILDSMGQKMPEPFLDITDKVFTEYPEGYDERGLLGLVFHPNYPDSPYFYVNYTALDSNSRISRYTVNPNNPNKALKHSQYIMLTVQQPKDPEYVNHKAGALHFGMDGYLYATFGDGGSAGDPMNNAQNPRILLGKMIRIDVNKPDTVRDKNYSVPASNPFVNQNDKFKDEIWATGLRNPWRFSFDRETGALWLPDVGQDKWEEINVVGPDNKGGKNFGWSCYESNHNFKFDSCDYNGTRYTFPVVEYKHSELGGAIIGGYVYRGTKFSRMQGKYFHCDYNSGKFFAVVRDNQSWLNLFMYQGELFAYSTFGEGWDGELYIADNIDGTIYHLVDSSDMQKIAANGLRSAPELKLYPNPNQGSFTVNVKVAKNETYIVSIENISGKVFSTEKRIAIKGDNRWSFNTRLDKGVYILHIQNGRETAKVKFIVN